MDKDAGNLMIYKAVNIDEMGLNLKSQCGKDKNYGDECLNEKMIKWTGLFCSLFMMVDSAVKVITPHRQKGET